jgi:hypothetical protein
MTSAATSTDPPAPEAPDNGEPKGQGVLRKRSRSSRGEVFLVARFRAADYAQLKRAFDDLQELRVRHGARGHRILRLADDTQDYMVIIEFASFGGAWSFTRDPLLLQGIDAAEIEGGAHNVHYVEEFRHELEAVDYHTW